MNAPFSSPLLGAPLDPRTLDFGDDYEHRIYLDDTLQNYVIVDACDYGHFAQWAWRMQASRGQRKFYAVRATNTYTDGVRTNHKLYLHVEVLKRSGAQPPTAAHIIADHRDGDSFNCRRANLRWATLSMNRRNLFGRFPHDLVEG